MLAKSGGDKATQPVVSNSLIRQAKTTIMLKLLDKIFPGLPWTSNWLHENVRKKDFWSSEYVILRYKGQPDGSGTEHYWEIEVKPEWSEKLKQFYAQVASSATQPISLTELPSKVLPEGTAFQNGTYTWNSLNFRSPAEIMIAEILENKGIPFFANSKCRVQDRLGVKQTKEVDFLIFYKGKLCILEVDGEEFHQKREGDYRRDRMFERLGIRTIRFSASECMNNTLDVIEEFLELFDNL